MQSPGIRVCTCKSLSSSSSSYVVWQRRGLLDASGVFHWIRPLVFSRYCPRTHATTAESPGVHDGTHVVTIYYTFVVFISNILSYIIACTKRRLRGTIVNVLVVCHRITIRIVTAKILGDGSETIVRRFFVVAVLKSGALFFGKKRSLKRKTNFIRRTVCTLWRVSYSTAYLTVP